MPKLYLVLFSLYWAQGLPVGFMTHALPVILRSQGVSLAYIGGIGLLMLPWSLKFFWAPWVDRCGQYRQWILPLQLLMLVLLLALSFFPMQHLGSAVYASIFFALLLLMNLSAATQDIATDGLAVSELHSQQHYWGNALQVIGSRLGFIVGGGAVLWAFDDLGWQFSFWILAFLVWINSLPIYFYQAQHRRPVLPQQFQLKSYWRYFRSEQQLRAWLWVLLSFKVADGLAGPLLKPLMVDLGLSLSQIGLYISILGAIAALLGAVMAGLCLRYIARASALMLFSVLKIFSFILYAGLAWCHQQQYVVAHEIIYAINAFEDWVGGLLLVVMLSLMMQYCRLQFAATDFTLQVAVMATVSGLLYSLSGMLAMQWGYTLMLVLISVISVLSLWPIRYWQMQNKHSLDQA